MPAKKAKKKKRERSWGEHKTAPKVAALMTNFSNRDRLTNEERLSDLVEILAHGLLWLDAFSVDLCAPCGRDRRLVRGASAIRRAGRDVAEYDLEREEAAKVKRLTPIK